VRARSFSVGGLSVGVGGWCGFGLVDGLGALSVNLVLGER
jgi:hypothetical protein